MEPKAIAPIIKACFVEMRGKLREAQHIAKAAEACVKAGRLDEAVQVSMGIEQLIYEADRLHDAVALLGRMIMAKR